MAGRRRAELRAVPALAAGTGLAALAGMIASRHLHDAPWGTAMPDPAVWLPGLILIAWMRARGRRAGLGAGSAPLLGAATVSTVAGAIAGGAEPAVALAGALLALPCILAVLAAMRQVLGTRSGLDGPGDYLRLVAAGALLPALLVTGMVLALGTLLPPTAPPLELFVTTFARQAALLPPALILALPRRARPQVLQGQLAWLAAAVLLLGLLIGLARIIELRELLLPGIAPVLAAMALPLGVAGQARAGAACYVLVVVSLHVSAPSFTLPGPGPAAPVFGMLIALGAVMPAMLVAIFADVLRGRASSEHDLAVLRAERLSTLSHEIRTPLNAINGTFELLAADPLAPGQRRLVAAGLNAGMDLERRLTETLELARLEARAIRIRPHRQGLDDMCQLWRTLGLAAIRRSDRALRLDFPPCTARDAVLRLDEARLRQVFVNLLDNAIRHTGQGTVSVGLLLHPAPDPPGCLLELRVSDTGPGIAEADRARIFEPFGQGRGGAPGSAGLGLAISRELVRLMGGEIGVESHPGHGSTFTVRLPAERIRERT